MSALEELRRSTERQLWRGAEAPSAPIKMSPLGAEAEVSLQRVLFPVYAESGHLMFMSRRPSLARWLPCTNGADRTGLRCGKDRPRRASGVDENEITKFMGAIAATIEFQDHLMQ
jgi:hypothetical protein